MQDQLTRTIGDGLPGKPSKMVLTTASVHASGRREWLQDTISREYTKVEVTPQANVNIFNEMSLYELGRLRLSFVRSSALTIERKKTEPHHVSQDNYLGVVLMSGHYHLKQAGREVSLKPGDMAIYDATRPHQITCSQGLSKLILTIPRTDMHARLSSVDQCMALRIPGQQGIGLIAGSFIRQVVQQVEHLDGYALSALSEQALDMFTLSLTSITPQSYTLSRSRSVALQTVKSFVEQHFKSPTIDTATVAARTGFSARYINTLFSEEDTSLMRYIQHRRLYQCSKDLRSVTRKGVSISEIAFNCGFNDFSHFSRAFKQQFGCSPRAYRQQCGEPR